uniref:Reverse transcriptase zinc-binding domain-containing protein n=1 Tax=Nicotiana tabacum TaxID=4097 RepID=A0A1S4D9T0_TOBAC|nr:PREDICTED: uncharacterized protein LOC107827363 [Nicotiana tabacum]
MCFPTEEGGAGFRSLSDFSEALAIKRWWRFRTCKSLWDELLKSKYCRLAHPMSKVWKNGQSHGWKKLLQVKDKTEEHMLWRINLGNSSLWWDNWTRMGPIAHIIAFEETPPDQQVKDLIYEGQWQIDHLHLPEYLAEHILKVVIGDPNSIDTSIWMPHPNGFFTTSSCWEIVRQKQVKDDILKRIWHKHIPFKMSFLVWRLLKRKLPFDDVVLKFGLNLASRCCCCRLSQEETMMHTFLTEELAVNMWKTFCIPLGIEWGARSIKLLLINWCSAKPKNSLHQELLRITPVIICWEVWKARCASRYGSQRVSAIRVKHQIIYHLRWAISKYHRDKDWSWNWFEICEQAIALVPRIDCVIVRWERPPHQYVKINTDGSRNEEGMIGAGGIVRDSTGTLVMTFAQSLGERNHHISRRNGCNYWHQMV